MLARDGIKRYRVNLESENMLDDEARNLNKKPGSIITGDISD